MRVLLIAAFLVFVLGLGAVLFLPGFVDVGDYRDKVSQTIEEIAGRKVKINGAVSFNVLPTPRISIEKLSIANLEGAQHEDFLTIDKLEGEISLFSLIKGDVKMSNLVLISPELNFNVSDTGEKAWQSNINQKNDNVFKRVATGIHFNDIKIQNGLIRYVNAQTGQNHEVTGIIADVIAEDIRGPFSVKGTSLYQENDVQFNIIGGKVTSEGSSPVRIEILSDKASLAADFAGVITVFEDADQGIEAQGETTIQIRDINRLESFSFIGGMEASLVKAKGFLTIDADKISITNISGEAGTTAFTGRYDVSKKEGALPTWELKAPQLQFIGVKSLHLNEDNFITKIPFGSFNINLGKAVFEDAVFEEVVVTGTKNKNGVSNLEMNTIAPGQTTLKISEGAFSEKANRFSVDLVSANAEEFFKWARFDILSNAIIAEKGRVSLKFKQIEQNGSKSIENFEWVYPNGKSFTLSYSEGVTDTTPIRKLTIEGSYLDFDAFGYTNLIEKQIKDNTWVDGKNWTVDVDIDEAKYKGQFLKKLTALMRNDKSQIEMETFYVEGLYGSTINAKGSFDVKADAKPFDVLVNVKSDDLKKLIEGVPFVIEFPSFEYGASDLSVSYARKEGKKNLVLSGKMMDSDWQMEGVLDDLAFKGNYDLKMRAISNNLESFFANFSKDVDLSLLKDKKGDFYTAVSKEGNNIKFSNLKGTVDGSAVNGNVHLIDKKLTIGLDVGTIVLDKNKTYLSLVKSILDKNELNGIFDIKTKKATFGAESFENIHANGSFDKDKITITKLPLSWKGKPHQVKGSVDWKAEYDFDITTDSFDIATFRHALPISASNASAQTKLRGNDGIYKGESNLEIKSGKLTKMDLAGLSSGLKGNTSVDALLSASFSKGETPFSLAKVALDFDTKDIKVKSFNIAGDFGKLDGKSGRYNFSDKSYEFDAEVKLVSPANVPVFDVNYSSKGNSFSANDLKSFGQSLNVQPVVPSENPVSQEGGEEGIGGILRRLEQEQGEETIPAVPQANPTPNTLQDIDLEEPMVP